MRRSVYVALVVILALLALNGAFARLTKAQEMISPQDAIDLVQILYPDALIVKTELISDVQPPYYVITLSNAKTLHINAFTREIVQIISPRPSVRGVFTNADAAKAVINARQAARIALSRFPEARVIEVELGRTSQRSGTLLVWEVELSNGYEVKINALTGSIISVERDDNRDDSNDRRDDKDDRNDRRDDDDDDDDDD